MKAIQKKHLEKISENFFYQVVKRYLKKTVETK